MKKLYSVKEHFTLLCIVVLGFWLRMFRIEQNFPFDGEVGDNLLDLKNAFLTHHVPLVGPPTSHPWLSFGPLFYWIYGPVLYFSQFNPLSHAYFSVFIAMLVLLCNYWFFKKIFSSFIALLSTLLISVSFMYIFATRLGRFTFIVSVLIYPFIYCLYLLLKGQKKYFLGVCFLLGTMLNFHYTPLFLIPVLILGMVIKKITITFKQFIFGIISFLLPLLPLLFYDMTHKFQMTFNLLVWIPYRILGFLGIYHKNTLTQQVLQENNLSFINFLSSSFSPTSYNSYTVIGIVMTVIILLYLLYKSVHFYRAKYLPTIWLILYIWGGIGITALFVHGAAPLHYFVPLFPLPILLFSLFLSDLITIKFGRLLTTILLSVLLINDAYFYITSTWFYQKEKTSPYSSGLVSYDSRKAATAFIIRQTQGKPYQLQRIGYNDKFDKQFAQNYLYLLWWLGNEPVPHARDTYIVVEDGTRLYEIKNAYTQRFIVNNLLVVKK